jgi:ribose transport system substrate-binding protein
MVADMGGKGSVLVFNGFYSVPVCKIRYDQMKYVLASFPDVKIIEPELRDVIPNTVQSAYSNITDMLTKYPNDGDISAVWACWDVPQIGATQAIEAAGRKGVMTYGVDGSPEYVEMVANPESAAAAVAAQQPYEIGKTSAQNVARFLAGEKVPPFTFVPAVLVTKENAKDTAAPFLKK